MIYREYIKYTYNYALIKFTVHGEYGSCLKATAVFLYMCNTYFILSKEVNS